MKRPTASPKAAWSMAVESVADHVLARPRTAAGHASTSRLQVLSVALGCAVVLAGCGGGTSSNAANKLPTAPASSTTAHESASRGGPHAGQCHLVSQAALKGKAFDRSEPVPCTSRHNVETASV